MTTKEIQQAIQTALPQGRVLSRHTDEGHFYEITDIESHPIYPSVTGKIACLKDPSINNFKMNQALGYVRENFTRFTPANIEEHMIQASRTPADIFEDAGDVGSAIHDVREKYFRDWISLGSRPETPILDYVPSDMGIKDMRVVSASRAINQFIADYQYEPIATELMVYSHELKTAGMLDDIGWVTIVENKGNADCKHDIMLKATDSDSFRCLKCDYKAKRKLALLDLKSSNQIKFYYAYQVSLYDIMFRKLTGIKPEAYYILKVSKTDGTYKLQELKNMRKIASVAKHIIQISDCTDNIIESFKKPTFKI